MLSLSPGISQDMIRESTGGRQKLPVRNQGTDIPGHVKCFREHNGLIHGGIIYKKNYTLTCKAYRYFRITSVFPAGSIGIVAGVCEQADMSGKVVNKWSTAKRLQNYYSSTSMSLLNAACQVKRKKTPSPPPPTRYMAYDVHGYYIPPFDGTQFQEMVSGLTPGNMNLPDTGIPFGTFYNPSPGGLFYISPKYKDAVENPLYNKPVHCTMGFPICTPYIMIFSPSPYMKETIVLMIGAYREKPKIGSKYYREAQWYCKTFR
jgi:hypothetical protein